MEREAITIPIPKENKIPPRKALNKAFLKVKPNRNEIELFKIALISLLNRIDEAESEEFHKNLIAEITFTHFDNSYIIQWRSQFLYLQLP